MYRTGARRQENAGCEAIRLRITKAYAHAFCLLPACHVAFQCHLGYSVEEKAGQWITLFRSPLYLEYPGRQAELSPLLINYF